ncbi:MAG TPA: hypothetical protein PL033_08380 [Candidatus Brocadiia bacterium]|nr:hypothetical protein [Candidatus Brocadiia bacterium]
MHLKELSPGECMPGARDYSLMWWAYGWRGRSPDARKVLCIQTGHYGLALDVERVELLNLGIIRAPKSYEEAAAEDNSTIFNMPRSELALDVHAGGARYRCRRGAVGQNDWLDYPVRIIESGRFVQRADIRRLEFEDDNGNLLPAEGRLEIVAWPDQASVILEITPHKDLPQSRIEIGLCALNADISDSTGRGESTDWKSGLQYACGMKLLPCAVSGSDEPATVEAVDIRGNHETLDTKHDAKRGWHRIELPKENWSVSEDPDHLDRIRLTVSNAEEHPATARLLFARDYPFPGVTGMTPMMRDNEGNPTGIPVQISKNWHRQPDKRFLYEGPWFHGFTQLRLPPKSRTTLEFNVTYALWGGVPAASHAQLCLIGWGMNQLWDQAAIGSWGESITYDPDVNLNRAMIDDVRPLMVWQMNAEKVKWGWTNNVGGGDFLVYFDAKGEKQFLARVKTAYLSYGPNFTKVIYAGISADGNIAARIEASTPRCDDINRAFHKIRYDVMKPTRFTRIAFYQLGADNYNDHQFDLIARGNAGGMIEEWACQRGGRHYHRTGIPCDGEAPWFSLHRAISRDVKGGAWANRGLIVRRWKAVLGGKDIPYPFASCFGTENGPPSMNVELSPPPGVAELLPGDFIEAEVEMVIIPMSGDEYYGPNENLRRALIDGADTWKLVHREAASNSLEIEMLRGRILRHYPMEIATEGNCAELLVSGGAGYVPITFTGLDSYRNHTILCSAEGKAERVDQSVHGNDFWQACYDADLGKWNITCNIPLDSPCDAPRKVRILLTRND